MDNTYVISEATTLLTLQRFCVYSYIEYLEKGTIKKTQFVIKLVGNSSEPCGIPLTAFIALCLKN